MFRKQIEFWLNCVEIYVHSPYHQFKLHHQSDYLFTKQLWIFLLIYDRTYSLEFNILDIYKGSLEWR